MFNNSLDAKRAELRLNELEFFGRELFVEFDKNDDKQDFFSSDVSSTTGSVFSMPLGPDWGVVPANDDKCKSVIIGLYTKYNQSVNKYVKMTEKMSVSSEKTCVLNENNFKTLKCDYNYIKGFKLIDFNCESLVNKMSD